MKKITLIAFLITFISLAGFNLAKSQGVENEVNYKQHSYIQHIVKKGFREFIEKHICCFDNYTDIKISFVGSIAYFFQDEMEYVGSEYGLSFDEFFRKPVFKLMEYHKTLEAVKIK